MGGKTTPPIPVRHPVPEPNYLLRAARERVPSRRVASTCMSRDELAEAVVMWLAEHDDHNGEAAFDGNHIGKLERGTVRRPRDHYVAALCAVLGANEAALGFDPRPVADLIRSVDWDHDGVATSVEMTTRDDLAATRRQALAAAALAGVALTQPLQRWLDPLGTVATTGREGAFTPPEIEALETLTMQFKGWNSAGNGVLARKAVVAQLSALNDRLRHAPPSSPLTANALLVASQLADIAASMSWDGGAHRDAQRYYVLAVQLAKVAGDDELAAVALAALGRQCYDLGHPGDGLEVVQLAQYGTRRSATPQLRAMLATREGWAYAQRGDVQAFHRAVGLAQDHFAEVAADSSRWVRTFDAAELHGVVGARFRDLARHDPTQARHAQDHITRALDLRNPSRLRNRAFDLIGLARSYLISGDPEHAANLINEALPIARTWANGRVGVKLSDFHRESSPFATVPEVRDTRDAIRDLVTA